MATSDDLIGRCDGVVTGAGQAIDWIETVRADSRTLDADADGLIERLRRHRNLARRLGAAAARPMAVGFFGLSQAGKSYLISALARAENGAVETLMDGQRLNFISHVNPPGSGKEATGIVTRFTRHPGSGPAGFPVALSLLSEADLVKIIGNTYFLDFDPQKVEYAVDHDRLSAHLAPLKKRAQARPTGGMTADDVVDVMDYFRKRFANSVKPFEAEFWPVAIRLAPLLSPEDRAQLFAPLWGEVPELVAAYLRLRQGLARLGHAPQAFAELGALVKPDGNGGFTQADSIMNVDMLARLGRDDADTVAVVPVIGGEASSSVAVPRSLLAALSREMAFALAEPPQAKLLETVDLLDFPGYRGRLKVANLKEVAERLEARDPVAELILRGKVAYLFERYTEDQEMNVLVMCTPSHKQSDVNDLGPALDSWIAATQGETPEERARRLPGLIWAVTMFDMRLSPRPDETEDLIRTGWSGMMKLALLEKFEQFEWVSKWTPQRPFDNLFLVRKPGMAAGVIKAEGRFETGIEPGQEARLDLLRRTFLAEPLVRRHLADAEAKWDAMMRLDDGGMGALVAYLERVARPEVKFDRIAERIAAMVDDIVNKQVGRYYRGAGEDEVRRKTEAAARVVAALKPRAHLLGELLAMMQPNTEHVRALYLRAEAEAVETAAEMPVSNGFISLDLEAPSPGFDLPTERGAAPFARLLLSDWQRQLRGLPDSLDVHRFFDLPKDILHIIVSEIVTGAKGANVERDLIALLSEAEERAGTTRARLADQQALVALAVIAEYVDTLGFLDQPEAKRPNSTAISGRKAFAPPPPVSGMPKLSERPLNYPAIRILDWLDAFTAVTIGNAGRDEGSEIGPEQNLRLGAILKTIAGATDKEAR